MENLEKAIAQIKEALPGMTLLEQEPLSAHCSFRIGGPARALAVPQDVNSLAKLCSILKDNELAPFILSRSPGYSGLMSFGCSLGGGHALNLYLRFPDLFDRCLALSGMYHASYFFGDYMDEIVYQNSPADYLAGMAPDHPYIAKYNRNRAVVCTGQGAWEEPWSPRAMDRLFREKGIRVWVDYWGWDVNHDWPWWHRQAAYFMPYLLDERTE